MSTQTMILRKLRRPVTITFIFTVSLFLYYQYLIISSALVDNNQSTPAGAKESHLESYAVKKEVFYAQDDVQVPLLTTKLEKVIKVIDSSEIVAAAALKAATSPRPVEQEEEVFGWDEMMSGIGEGEWVRRSPEMEVGELEELLEIEISGGDEERRSVDLLNWVWTKESEIKRLDAEMFISKSLSSAEGVVMVGDSITLQIYQQIYSLLKMKFPEVIQERTIDYWEIHPRAVEVHLHLPSPPTESSTQIVLDPYLEFRKLIQGREERLNLPIVTFLRNDFLLTPDELTEVVLESGWVGGEDRSHWQPNLEPPNGDFTSIKWDKYTTQFHSPDPQFPSSAFSEGPQEILPPPKGGKQHPSLWIINTGAHWDPWQFGLPAEVVAKAHDIMVKRVMNKIRALPSKPLVIFRSTTAAHSNCGDYNTPVNDNISAEDSSEGHGHGWDKAVERNMLWRNEIAKASNSLRIKFFDAWKLTATRPDAHRVNGGDCVHFKQPAVIDPLINILWTLTLKEW